jgi:hypothetical protein
MPLLHGKSKKVVEHNIHEMVKAGHPAKQAVAASLSSADKYAKGGMPKMYAEGGEAEGDNMEHGDDSEMMDQCASELMESMKNNDKAGVVSAIHGIVAHFMMSMKSDENMGDE